MWTKINWNDNTTVPNEIDEIRLAYKFKDFNLINEEGTSYYIGNKEFRSSDGYLCEVDFTDDITIWWCYAPVFEGEE